MRVVIISVLAAFAAGPMLAQSEQEKVYTPTPEQAAKMFAGAEEVTASLNPLDNDLRNLEVAIQVPDAFRVPENGATFDFGVKLGDGSMPIDERFVLEPAPDVPAEALDDYAVPRRHIRAYRIADADKARMGAAYEKLQKLRKTKDPTGRRELNFSISSNACLVDPANAPATYISRSFARSDARVPFVPMSNDWVIERDKAPDWLDFWEPCAPE